MTDKAVMILVTTGGRNDAERLGEGLVVDIILGIVGAFVGGFLFTQFGAAGVTGFNLYSMFVAVIGAIAVLLLYHLVIRQRTA